MIRQVPNRPNISVSEDGTTVVWTPTGKIIVPYEDKDGYLRINYRGEREGVHRLVAFAFVANPNPDKFKIVGHLDGNNKNNHYTNLEWTTVRMNNIHRELTSGRHIGEEANNYTGVVTESQARQVCELLSLGVRICDIVKMTGVQRHNVNNIKKGLSWRKVSKDFDFVIARDDTLSKATLDWVEDQVRRGRTFEEILTIAKRLDRDKLARAFEILKIVV